MVLCAETGSWSEWAFLHQIMDMHRNLMLFNCIAPDDFVHHYLRRFNRMNNAFKCIKMKRNICISYNSTLGIKFNAFSF